MQRGMPQNMEILRGSRVPSLGVGVDEILGDGDKRGKEWWLHHFGIYVEPNLDITGSAQITSYKIWERKNGGDAVVINYGTAVGKLWVTLREAVR